MQQQQQHQWQPYLATCAPVYYNNQQYQQQPKQPQQYGVNQRQPQLYLHNELRMRTAGAGNTASTAIVSTAGALSIMRPPAPVGAYEDSVDAVEVSVQVYSTTCSLLSIRSLQVHGIMYTIKACHCSQL
jgi:hypothetical protein